MKILNLFFVFSFMVFSSCLDDIGIISPGRDKVLYSNSFENYQDTIGLQGYGSFQIRKEASPNGGIQSLFISGGCIVPHAYFQLNIIDEDCSVILQCWGKSLLNGGSVSIKADQYNSSAIGIMVTDSVWTFYESKDTLQCKANQPLLLNFMSGGFVPGSMLVDQVKIIKIKK
jgi:hypothetical protein